MEEAGQSAIERAVALERIVEITPAHHDPRVELVPMPGDNTGVESCLLGMTLKGLHGAIEFSVSPGWFLDQTLAFWDRRGLAQDKARFKPIPWCVGCHAKTPQYEGQTAIQSDCPYTDGACYYDSSGLRANDWFKELVKGGSDRIWELLEAEYRWRFEGGPEPEI